MDFQFEEAINPSSPCQRNENGQESKKTRYTTDMKGNTICNIADLAVSKNHTQRA